jgi:hypothetical protein
MLQDRLDTAIKTKHTRTALEQKFTAKISAVSCYTFPQHTTRGIYVPPPLFCTAGGTSECGEMAGDDAFKRLST